MHDHQSATSIPMDSPSPWRLLLWIPALILGAIAVIVFLSRRRSPKQASA